MQRKNLYYRPVFAVVLSGLLMATAAQAAGKDLDSGKRVIYEDGSAENMREMYIRREAESKEYKQKILSNGEESVALLKEIRDLLKQLNEKQ